MHTKTTFEYASTRTGTQTCEESGLPPRHHHHHHHLLNMIKEKEGKTEKMFLIFIKHHAKET
jgi:hypothetical protein